MKAGEVQVVQYDTEHGGCRVLPLCSVAEIGRLETLGGARHSWIAVGYAVSESQAHERMQAFRAELKKATGSGRTQGEPDLFKHEGANATVEPEGATK